MFDAKVPVWFICALIAYFFTFMIVTGAIFYLQSKRRGQRPPEKFKLLRAPGETLRRRVQTADEDVLWRIYVGACVPLFLGWFALLGAARLPKNFVLPGVGVALLLFIAAVVVSAALLIRFMRRRQNDLLGYLGERAVAENLERLREQGYRLFHDVPAESRKNNFNLDHVAVGPTGVAVIETKTRRKKKGRPDFKEHVVTFDGKRLIWPWGEDRCGLDQVVAEADWLRKWIEKRVGLRVYPKPIVSFPGWCVIERAVGEFRVMNHSRLANVITQWNPQPLTPEQVDLISRQLDALCRDVED
jgi:Nuclease-related domain